MHHTSQLHSCVNVSVTACVNGFILEYSFIELTEDILFVTDDANSWLRNDVRRNHSIIGSLPHYSSVRGACEPINVFHLL